MIDADIIQHCADPGLRPAIVEKFIEQAGSADPIAVTIRSGNRVVLVPKPATADEALALIREHVGRNIVRVGITQFPAGLGIHDASQVSTDLIDACENVRMGTALFAKVYRIVTRWYGNAVEEAFDDAILAWQTGYFEGVAVFRADDPGDITTELPGANEKESTNMSSDTQSEKHESDSGAVISDPNKAGIRIDLSDIGRKTDL